jgi:SAM-dependent methyltransferase
MVLKTATRRLLVRLRDLIPDTADRLLGPAASLPVPPAKLRGRVGRTSSRDEYIEGGAAALAEILVAFYSVRDPSIRYPAWLDFGCGPARIARYFSRVADCQHLVGVDVDAEAVAWAQAAHPFATFKVIAPEPPLPFEEGFVHVAFAASVFTHFAEAQQFAWLAELRRVLAPGGLLIASTHSEKLSITRPDLSDGERSRLASSGFGFAHGTTFNAGAAFHTRSYLEEHWKKHLQFRWYRECGLFQFQDLSVWSKDGS